MKRKNYAVLTLLLCLACAALFTACGGKAKNVEFAEYKEIATKVIDNSLQQMSEEGGKKEGKKLNAQQSASMLPFAITEQSKQGIFDIADNASDRERTDIRSFFQDAFEQSFYMPLICGDVITEKKNATKFYGVSCALPFWGQAIMTESEGTRKISYGYSAETSGFGIETFIVMEIDFKSETDYVFRCLQFSHNYSEQLFLYGNSKDEFIALSKSDGTQSQDNSYIQYRHNGQAYSTRDLSAVNAAYALVADEFTAADVAKIRAVGKSQDYIMTQAEWDEARERYFGNQNPEQYGWRYGDDKSVGYGYRGETAADTLTVPADMTAFNYNLMLEGRIGKLVIPKTVTKIKITQSELDAITDNTSANDASLVDCPVKYFTLEARLGGQTPVGYTIGAIEVESGSPIFTVIDGNLWTADGKTLLYICDNASAKKLDVRGKEFGYGITSGMSLGTRDHFSSLKELAYDRVLLTGSKYPPEGSVFDLFSSLTERANAYGQNMKIRPRLSDRTKLPR